MTEPLLNPVQSAPDERYCDWIYSEVDEKGRRCKSAPRFKFLTKRGTVWKLCRHHKELLLDSYSEAWRKKEKPLWKRI